MKNTTDTRLSIEAIEGSAAVGNLILANNERYNRSLHRFNQTMDFNELRQAVAAQDNISALRRELAALTH